MLRTSQSGFFRIFLTLILASGTCSEKSSGELPNNDNNSHHEAVGVSSQPYVLLTAYLHYLSTI